MPEAVVSVDVDRIVEAWNLHDLSRLVDCFTADAVYDEVPFGAPAHGRPGISGLLGTFIKAFPDLVMTPGKRVSQADSLVWEWLLTGTHRGEFGGVPPTGRALSLRGVSFCTLREGKIAEAHSYWDLASLLKQLLDAV